MMPRPFFEGNQAIYKEVIPMTQIVVLDGFTETPATFPGQGWRPWANCGSIPAPSRKR